MSIQYTPKVAVVGSGKMGLPIATFLSGNGADVTACDIDTDLVEAINEGDCPFDEPGLEELLHLTRSRDRIRATTDIATAVAAADVTIVLVPVLLNQKSDADLAGIEKTARLIGQNVRAGALVVFETTLPVGTTRRLARLMQSIDPNKGAFHVAFSPERVKSGYVLERLPVTPKVVGGLTKECAEKAERFYAEFLGAPVINVRTLEAAELTKLADMIYRDVNIALANEIARYSAACGVDFQVVRDAANTSGESHLLQPGIGVGGHCTPVYPYFAIHDARRRGIPLELPAAGRRINDDQARHLLQRLEESWEILDERNVVILGLGFRPEVKEHTASTAYQIAEELGQLGAFTRLHDPLYTEAEVEHLGFWSMPDFFDEWPEVLVLNTAHKAYLEMDWETAYARGIRAVVDGRGAWKRKEVEKAGIIYVGVGVPSLSCKDREMG